MTDAYSADAAHSTESSKNFSACITIPISWPHSVSSSEEVQEVNNEFENHCRFGVTENRKSINDNFSLLVDHEFHILNHVSDHVSRSASFLENKDTIHFEDNNFNENLLNESCEDFGCDNLAFSKEVKEESSIEIEEAELQEPLENLSPAYEEIATKVVSLKPSESVLRKQLPTYLSLSNEFLSDEPPRYELVTGKKLKSELEITPPSPPLAHIPSAQHQQSRKKRLLILIIIIVLTIIIVIFFVLGKKLSSESSS